MQAVRHVSWSCALVAVMLMTSTATYYDDNPYYSDSLRGDDDVYAQLDELAKYFSGIENVPNNWIDENIQLDSREIGHADRRDEYLDGGPNIQGFQYISGGAGEGDQYLTPTGKQNNTQEVKSDEALPFYCHPPNPCPKGFTAEKNHCDEKIKDTAEEQKNWIHKSMETGQCSCDEEHMFSCAKVNGQPKQGGGQTPSLDDFLADSVGNPYSEMLKGNQHFSTVAKKSPGIYKRSTDRASHRRQEKRKNNPYLAGEKLRTVAKKGVLM